MKVVSNLYKIYFNYLSFYTLEDLKWDNLKVEIF